MSFINRPKQKLKSVLSIFRTNQLVLGILLLIYALILRSSIFFQIDTSWTPNTSGILQQWLFSFIGTQGLLADTIALLVVFINATLINHLAYRHHLNTKYNLFPGLFYILFSSSATAYLHFSSFHLANTFLLLAMSSLYKLTPKSVSIKDIFNAGLLIAIASLFNFSYYIFFFWTLIGINTLQAARFKKTLILFSGFIIPWFYVFVYFFWHGKTEILWQEEILRPIKFATFSFVSNISTYGALVFTGIIFLILLFTIWQNFAKQKFEIKKKLSLLFRLFILALFPFLLSANVGIENLLIFSVPAGIFLGFSFTRMSGITAEISHLLLFLFVILLSYEALFDFFK